jgi:hypothetical protein
MVPGCLEALVVFEVLDQCFVAMLGNEEEIVDLPCKILVMQLF